MATQGGSAPEHDHKHHLMYHVSSISSMVAVWAIRWRSTFLTVWVADHGPRGSYDIIVAMVIATVKGVPGRGVLHASIYDRPFNGFLIIASVFFVLLFVGICTLDSMQYQPEIQALTQNTQAP